MALIKCTECGGTVSDSASVCPHCGAPIIKCSECGHLIPAGHPTCPNCGAQAPAVVEEVVSGRSGRPAADAAPATPRGEQPPASPRRFRISAGAVILVLVLLFLVFTRPSQQKHEQVIEELINGSVSEMRQSLGMGTGFDAIGNLVADEITKMFMGRKFDVDNYLLFSIGKIHMDNDDHVVTFGIANHVFCFFSKADVKAAVRRLKEEQRSNFDSVLDVFRNVFGLGGSDADSTSESEGSEGSLLDKLFHSGSSDASPDEVLVDTLEE